MNDDRRKLLTEYLGECWPSDKSPLHKCIMRRTFTTPDDFFALKEKLVEKGDWREFLFYCADVSPIDSQKSVSWYDWLINPTRFCELVAEWLDKARK